MQTAARAVFGVLPFAVVLNCADTRYASGAKALAIPFEIENGIIYLGVSVNGSTSRSFILDTGASYTVLSLPDAKSFGLALQPMGKVEGGSGDAPPDHYLITDNVVLGLPGIVFSSQNAMAMSFNMLQDCFEDSADRGRSKRVLSGILGKDFFNSHVVGIDYAARMIDVYDPHSYTYRGKGKTLPLEIGDYIYTQAQISVPGRHSIRARLMIDTGASAPLTLTKEFVNSNGLLPAAGRLTELHDCGIGGYAKGKSSVGRLRSIELGGFKVSNPLTVFLQNPEALDYDGVLGNSSLWAFNVIFDYSRRRMILESWPRARGR